jgi:hypothetical protein
VDLVAGSDAQGEEAIADTLHHSGDNESSGNHIADDNDLTRVRANVARYGLGWTHGLR